MNHDDLSPDRARSLLTDAQRALLDLYGADVIEVLETRCDDAGLAIMVHPAKPMRRLCLYISSPISEWMRNMRYFMEPAEHGQHIIPDVYGTVNISPRGYGSSKRG